jgi:hypothetical protein
MSRFFNFLRSEMIYFHPRIVFKNKGVLGFDYRFWLIMIVVMSKGNPFRFDSLRRDKSLVPDNSAFPYNLK